MRRGSTPEIHLTAKNITLADYSTIYITLKQGTIKIDKTGADLTVIPSTGEIYLSLTQAETLSLQSDGYVQIQARAKSDAGSVVGSNIITVPVAAVLKEAII